MLHAAFWYYILLSTAPLIAGLPPGQKTNKFMLDLWTTNHRLAGKFVGFMSTSTGDNFGYLIDMNNKAEENPIIYYSDNEPDKIYVISSSFLSFMTVFLKDIKNSINEESFLVNIDKYVWPINVDYFRKDDKKLDQMYSTAIINKYII